MRATSAEIYGTAEVPPQAALHFQGVDQRSARVLNTPWFKTMTVRDKPMDINVDGQIICGTLFMPPHASALCSLSEADTNRTAADAVGILSLLSFASFPMPCRCSRNGRPSSAATCATYRVRSSQPRPANPPPSASSQQRATIRRASSSLAVRAAALYKDADWEVPKSSFTRTRTLPITEDASWLQRTIAPSEPARPYQGRCWRHRASGTNMEFRCPCEVVRRESTRR